ncbi:MAG: coniferyl aldehyde dehydrogenase [Xanthomonadales bacterium]|nr:Coniferyl aldehyde dehydrogenase [Xanthomonadales bacterium]MCC6591854.1 coniferyl aldehyde dehydrogenase [Xanthomonadales bacterium]MCE7931972.1 coniferyl aldehyde dehydrogenase [Xanthomonadales bacterium PRO6]
MDGATPDLLTPLLQRQRLAHARRVPDHAQRVADLKRLRAAVKKRAEDIVAAVATDFGRRSRHETLLSDVMTVLHDIDHAVRHLKRWMKPRRVATDWQFLPGRSQIRYQPVGVVGIIAPWNYPVNLALMPLVAAIAAGNHAMLKPSELTPRTSDLLKALLADVFPEERVAVVLGGPDVAAAFSALPFDHLFFTGSTQVGRLVMQAAAKNLTPVTLELGGKSPAIVAPDYPIETAAARLAAGKFLNAGQTCIAPDYVLCHAAKVDALVAALEREVRERYPSLAQTPDYTSIVNDRQYARLAGLLEEAQAAGARVLRVNPAGETLDPASRVFAPTLVLDAPADTRLMREEIFGPILPIVPYQHLDEAITYVNAHERPLALYHFDLDGARVGDVLDRTIAGGVTVNDCVLHIAQSALPFGGIGPSGIGHYHGHHGFLTFSKQKPVFYQARWSSLSLLKPPYRKLADVVIRFLTR